MELNPRADGTKYDVCLSFASEQRPYVDRVAQLLRARGVRVFYDAYERADLWGRNLTERLQQVYGEESRFCVLFASADYARKVWTNHELRSAMERALQNWNTDYVLPVRFDQTRIPGLHGTVAYIDGNTTPPHELVELILTKLRRSGPPPQPPVWPVPETRQRGTRWRWSFAIVPIVVAGLVTAIVLLAPQITAGLGNFVRGLSSSNTNSPEQVVQDATGQPPWVVEGHGYRFSLEKVAHGQGSWQSGTKPALIITGYVTRTAASNHSNMGFQVRDQTGTLLEKVPFRGSGDGNPPLNQPSKLELVVWNNSSSQLTITIHDFFWPDGRDLILRNVPVPKA